MGFSDFKIKVGGAPLDVDVERVRVAREMIGPRARLGLDANNAWRTPSEALRFARAVEKYEPWWLEEPLLPDDIEGHAQIAAALDWPVATGEIHSSRWDFRALIEKRAADILQPDAGVLGGVGEWMRVAHAAATFDIPVAPHWHADIHVHLVAAVPNALTVEYFSLDEDIYNFERLLHGPAPAEGRPDPAAGSAGRRPGAGPGGGGAVPDRLAPETPPPAPPLCGGEERKGAALVRTGGAERAPRSFAREGEEGRHARSHGRGRKGAASDAPTGSSPLSIAMGRGWGWG